MANKNRAVRQLVLYVTTTYSYIYLYRYTRSGCGVRLVNMAWHYLDYSIFNYIYQLFIII